MSISVSVQQGDLQVAIKQLQNPNPLLQKIGQYLVSTTQARIRSTKTSPDGKQWAPWARSTFIARSKAGTLQGGLLYNSGRLFNSIGYRVNGNTIEIQSSAPYARYLQLGTKNMPARPFLGISTGDSSAITGLVRRHLRA